MVSSIWYIWLGLCIHFSVYWNWILHLLVGRYYTYWWKLEVIMSWPLQSVDGFVDLSSKLIIGGRKCPVLSSEIICWWIEIRNSNMIGCYIVPMSHIAQPVSNNSSQVMLFIHIPITVETIKYSAVFLGPYRVLTVTIIIVLNFDQWWTDEYDLKFH